MGHTRTVTGLVHRPDGSPWDDFQFDFTLVPSAVTTHATLPSATVSATTETDGTFSIDLEVGVTYQVSEYSALIRSGTSTRYPSGTQYTIVVPDGEAPISLHEIRAADATPVTPTLAGRVLPDGGTTGQALVKASDSDYDATWSDVEGGGGGAVWGGINGEIGDQTDLATALDTKAATADLGTAAYTDSTAYATAAQGGRADTAVQPSDLADVATSGAYGDLTGTPTIPTLPTTIVESVVAGTNVTVDSTDPAHPVVSAAGGGGGPALAGDGVATTAAKSDHQHAGANAQSVVVGTDAIDTAVSCVAVGYQARVFAVGATAIGRTSRANGVRSIALGPSAIVDAADTTVIKANDLDVQRSNGTGATRFALYSPNGTKYWLTVDDSGNLAATPA